MPLGYEVDRRFSDFFWLRETLIRDHPGVFVPPMAKKSGSGTNKMEASYIMNRLAILQEFVTALAYHTEILADPSLLAFLSAKDQAFEKYKKDCEKSAGLNSNALIATSGLSKKLFLQKQPVRVEALTTTEGSADVKINPALGDYSAALNQALKSLFPGMAKCKEHTKTLASLLSQVKLAVDKLADSVAGVYTTAKKFGDTTFEKKLGRWSELEGIFLSLFDCLKSFGGSFDKQNTVLMDTLFHSFRYAKKEVTVLEELCKLRDDSQKLFMKSYFELESKKDKAFKVGDPAKFGLDPADKASIPKEELVSNKVIAKQVMFKEESNQIICMQKFYGYLNNQLYVETENYQQASAVRHKRIFIKFARSFSSLFEEVDYYMTHSFRSTSTS